VRIKKERKERQQEKQHRGKRERERKKREHKEGFHAVLSTHCFPVRVTGKQTKKREKKATSQQDQKKGESKS